MEIFFLLHFPRFSLPCASKVKFKKKKMSSSSPQQQQQPGPPEKPAPPMALLQHTIIRTRDSEATARLLSKVAGLGVGDRWHHFQPLTTANGVVLDLLQVDDGATSSPIAPQHYAFLTDDAGFDAGLQALKDDEVDFWAHHNGAGRGRVNELYGGRGLYFKDPASGHNIELMTAVYGDPREIDEALESLKVEEEKEEEEEKKREEEKKKKREE